jgi:hypothetical protein
LFLAVEQLLLKGFAVFTRRFPEPALLGLQQSLGEVSQSLGVMLTHEVAGRRVEHIGIGQRLIMMVIDQVCGGIESEQVVDRRRQFEGPLVAVPLGPVDPFGVEGSGANDPVQFLLRVRIRGRSTWLWSP